MKKKLIYHKIPARTQEWFDFRKNGVGCSEIRAIIYPDDYSDALVLYYDKLGFTQLKPDNEAMFSGRHNEEFTAWCWQFWDGTKDEFDVPNYVNNANNKRIIRKCRNLNSIVVNEKYPWLFGNVDRIINKRGGFSLITGEPLKEEGVLEIKHVEGFSVDKWKFGIDPAFLYQLNGYLIIMELGYGEVAVHKNGRYLDVWSFELSPVISEQIIEQTHAFWYNHVVPGSQWVQRLNEGKAKGDEKLIQEANNAIQYYEPKVGNSKAAEDFIKARFHKDKQEVAGTDECYELAKKDKFYGAIKTEIDKLKQQVKNEILVKFFHEKTEFITFGEKGSLRYFIKEGGKEYQLGNNIKFKPDKDVIIEQISKLSV